MSKSLLNQKNIFNYCLFFLLLISFDFCSVKGERSPEANLGQVLFGERIRPSPYKVSQLGKVFILIKDVFFVVSIFN